MKLLDPSQVSVVLVDPTQPGNVGATARAMDNMGVTDLRLVNPCHYFHADARMFSMNARYLLHQAKTFDTLREAIADKQLIIGTTARSREKIRSLKNIRDLGDILTRYQEGIGIAVVFGTEQSGLTNDDLNLCNEWVYIPTYGRSSSLNLSQAVMVSLFELSKYYEAEPVQQVEAVSLASSKSIEGLKGHLFRILDTTGFLRRSSKDTLWSSFSDIIGRAKLDERDVRIIRGFFNRIEVTLKHKPRKRKRE